MKCEEYERFFCVAFLFSSSSAWAKNSPINDMINGTNYADFINAVLICSELSSF